MIAVACPSCGGDTLWRYPSFQWARTAVPDLPPRCFRSANPDHLQGWDPCPDPTGHLEGFRGKRAEVVQ